MRVHLTRYHPNDKMKYRDTYRYNKLQQIVYRPSPNLHGYQLLNLSRVIQIFVIRVPWCQFESKRTYCLNQRNEL